MRNNVINNHYYVVALMTRDVPRDIPRVDTHVSRDHGAHLTVMTYINQANYHHLLQRPLFSCVCL